MNSLTEMQSMASNAFSAYASVAASMILLRSVAHNMVPEPVKSFFYRVDEQNGITRNQIYDTSGLKSTPDADRLKVNKNAKQKKITLSMVKDQEVSDWFQGFEVKWQFVLVEAERDKASFQPEKRYFELTFEKSNKESVVNEYLPFLLAKAKEIKEKERAIKLYMRKSVDLVYSNVDLVYEICDLLDLKKKRRNLKS